MTIRLTAAATTWQSRAACRGLDPELFFPERGQSTKDAKEVCKACDVRADCLTHSLTLREGPKPMPGIWGGTSERERRLLRRGRPTRQPAWYELDPALEKIALAMEAAGATNADIGTVVGVGKQAIRNWRVRRRQDAENAAQTDEEVA